MSLKSLVLSRYVLPRRACVAGPKLERYERVFAAATGARHAVGFMKGRLAFYAALKALGIKEGDEIIMPGYTCMVVPAAAMHLGARPVYVDIEPEYCTLDPDKLDAALTPRTRAVMIQHTYGWPNVGIDSIIDFTNRHGLFLLEDCCHALGTRMAGRHVGNFGVAAFFSSQWSKPFTTGLGGMLICNDDDFFTKVRQVREECARPPSAKTAAQLAIQGLVYDLFVYPATMSIARRSYRWLTKKAVITGSTSTTEYTRWDPSEFVRMSEVQAAAGLYELGHLDATVAHRRDLNDWYASALKEAGFHVPAWPDDSDPLLLRFPVRVRNKPELLAVADRHLVELGDWFLRPLHSTLARQEDFGYIAGMCPEGERAAREIVNLPTHLRVGRKHAMRAISMLREHSGPP